LEDGFLTGIGADGVQKVFHFGSHLDGLTSGHATSQNLVISVSTALQFE
jgi:hypothetical protein